MSTTSLSRRDMLKVSALGAGALVLPFERVVRARDAGEMDPRNFPKPYSLAYVEPDVIDMRGGGEVQVKQVMFDVTILPKYKTKVFGYEYTVDGQVKRSSPGPTVLCEKDRPVTVRMENALPAKHPKWGYATWTSNHLHGSASKPQFDGYASDITNPGEVKVYEYPNVQNARTLWYHDHGVHHTAENAYMGLAGMYILSDPKERALNLPSGNYDLPIVVTDKQFDKDGSLMFDDEGHSGLYGDVVLVNGVPWPNLKVDKCKYRFRILNASLSRGLRLKLSRGTMTVIGTDGGLMPEKQDTDVLRVGMGERYEIVVDFSTVAAGTKIQLTNLGVPNSRDYDHTNKIMQFEVTANHGPAFDVPPVLDDENPVMRLHETPGLAVVKLRLHRSNSTWKVNDDTWDDIVKSNYQKVVANPAPGETQIWEIENSSGGWFHPTHLHLVDFKMLTRNGRPVANYEKGPKDVAYVGENETVRLLVKFEHQEGRYMIHCHNLPHEDHDMMTQFRVGSDHGPDDPAKFNDPMGVKAVKVGQAPGTPASSSPAAPTTTSAAPTSTSSATVLPVVNPAPTTSVRPTTTTRQTSPRQTTTRRTTTRPTTTTRRR
jgi:spore coat protein A